MNGKTLTPAVKAAMERHRTAKSPAQRLADDLGIPIETWTGFKPLPVKKPPTDRTRQRAAARAMALDVDLEKEKARIDGTGKEYRRRYRGGSRHIEPPSNNVNVCHRTMIWNAVEKIERNSYARRGRYRRNGTLGKVAVELMRTILFRVNKSDDGKVYPSYQVLAELTLYCQRALINAMAKLMDYGVITRHRRCKWEDTRYGRRCVQASNAYEYHMPKSGLGLLAMRAFASSDCTGIREDKHTQPAERLQKNDVEDRFWMVEPQQNSDGTWW